MHASMHSYAACPQAFKAATGLVGTVVDASGKRKAEGTASESMAAKRQKAAEGSEPAYNSTNWEVRHQNMG